MKVAQFINSKDPGGAENVVANISSELSAQGIENIVFHHGNDWLNERLNVPHYVLPETPITKVMKFGRTFGEILKEHDITHLHSHLYGATIRGAFAAYQAKIPHIATQHDIYTLKDKESRIRWLKVVTKLGTKLITVSNQMNSVYRDISNRFTMCKLPDRNPITIYNGVDTMMFRPSALVPKSRYLMNILCVGRLVEVKNHILLIRAIQQLTENGVIDIRLQLVGEGPLENKLKEYVREHDLEPWVRFLGPRDDIADLLNQHDLFVLPSHTEGLSCSILEAMACGLPIIASDVGGNSELVKDEVNGWLFPTNDLETLTRKIQLAYNIKDALRDIGRQSSNIIDESFSLRTMTEQYVAVYQGK